MAGARHYAPPLSLSRLPAARRRRLRRIQQSGQTREQTGEPGNLHVSKHKLCGGRTPLEALPPPARRRKALNLKAGKFPKLGACLVRLTSVCQPCWMRRSRRLLLRRCCQLRLDVFPAPAVDRPGSMPGQVPARQPQPSFDSQPSVSTWVKFCLRSQGPLRCCLYHSCAASLRWQA